jgi:NTE family protein
MGSVIGGFRACCTTPAEMRAVADYWRTRTWRFLEWRVWNLSLLNERMVKKVFRGYFGGRKVNATEIPFWANAVDIQAGKEYALRDGTLVDCVRASIALPGLLPPVARDDRLLVDPGVMNPVPVQLVREMGANFVIGVNAMVPPGSRKITGRYPRNLLDVLTRCMLMIGHEIGQAAAEEDPDILFTPELGDIGMLQFGRSSEIIEAGRHATEKRIPAISSIYERRKAEQPQGVRA